MQTQAYFDNIQHHILQKLKAARSSIYVAVAWMTDSVIFDALCGRAKNGLKVELLLLDDEINNNMAPFDHSRLSTCGGVVCFVSPQLDGAIMHHKFCIVDDCTVITGSYNWSKKAQLNDENIVITTEACDLGAQFKKEFDTIKRRTSGGSDEAVIDFGKIVKRLEVIKSFAALEEQDEISGQIRKLRVQTLPQEVTTIIQKLEKGQFAEALVLIEAFFKAKNTVSVLDDTEIFGLQLEIKSLEVQLNALENELIEAEKLVHEFLVRHTKELGSLILELLELKKLTAKTTKEAKEAEEDQKTYREGYEANKDVQISELTEEEKAGLKKMYKEASMLCHPDRFANEPPEKQKQAEEMFKQLADAYSNNDTTKVASILDNLRKGILSVEAKLSNKKDKLKVTLTALQNKMSAITERLIEIKLSETFVTATQNPDWDTYFARAQENFRNQIEKLKEEFGHE